jgi:RNA polymerase sigma-70 factor (ECF subfamily)
MPPHPFLYDGIEQVRPLIAEGLPGAGEWRVLPTSANRMPAAACYLREPGGTEFRAFKIDVLRLVDGKVAEVTTFDAKLFGQFGLPATV